MAWRLKTCRRQDISLNSHSRPKRHSTHREFKGDLDRVNDGLNPHPQHTPSKSKKPRLAANYTLQW